MQNIMGRGDDRWGKNLKRRFRGERKGIEKGGKFKKKREKGLKNALTNLDAGYDIVSSLYRSSFLSIKFISLLHPFRAML